RKGCNSIVRAHLHSKSFLESNNVNHNHPPDEIANKRKLLLDKIKERIVTEPTSVIAIIEQEYAKANLSKDEQYQFLLPSAQVSLASTMHKLRVRQVPPNPDDQLFDVPALFKLTHSGEDFILYDTTKADLGERLMIFSTSEFLKMLCECDVIYLNGTFKTRPLLFKQFYVIKGKHRGEG
ncbi:unnamed protein product, partial [Didymodactylos carnosus]